MAPAEYPGHPRTCSHCEAEARRLFAVTVPLRRGGQAVLEVCSFCYLRRTGRKPKPRPPA